MIINATSKTMQKIWKLFLFIFISFIIFILLLREGVRIENISLPFVKVTQFYIKLDKKLIVSAKDVKIARQESQGTSLIQFINLAEQLPILNALFASISIQNLIYEDNTVHFLFKNNIFYIDSKYLTIDASLKQEKGILTLDIKDMILKDYNTELKGALHVNFNTEIYDFEGDYNILNITGHTKLLLENSKLSYKLDTKELHSIVPFMEYLNTKVSIEPQINDWIYKNIIAQKYKVENLEGVFDIKTLEYFPEHIKALAKLEDIEVAFRKNVPPAKVNKMDVVLENNTLMFKTDSASYQGKIVKEPKVYIYRLLSKGSGIIVDINSNSILDDDIHKILNAFRINIPIHQTSGSNHSNIILDVDFDPIGINNANGIFQFNETLLSLAGLELEAKNGIVSLENNLVNLENVHMKHKELFDINVSGSLDLNTKVFHGSALINTININLGEQQLLHVENQKTQVQFEIQDKATVVSLLDLDTNLIFEKDRATFLIHDIKHIIPHSQLLQTLEIKDANISIHTKDYKNFQAKANIKNLDTPLYKNGLHVRNLSLDIQTDSESFEASTLENSLQIQYKNGLHVKIQDMDILQDLSANGTQKQDIDISLQANNVNIIDKNSSHTIKSEFFELQKRNDITAFQSKYQGGTLHYEKGEKYLYINIQKATSDFLNALANKEFIKNGNFDIMVDGKNEKEFDGMFFMSNTTIKDLKFFNNLMAFINTIPSLVVFKDPKFNENGYEVQDGFISFTRKKNTLALNEIKLKGYSADISGKGAIFLDTDAINFELQISTLKSVSNILKNIPIINDIVLGEDGRIYTSISVKGTLEKPEISTNLLSETIFTPVNILKRTIQLPFKMFK